MSGYHSWRENVVWTHAKLSIIMYLLYELNDQLRPAPGIMGCSGFSLDAERFECISNAARDIRDLRWHLDKMLDEAERKHENRKRSDGKTK